MQQINDLSFWNDYFQEGWEKNQGRGQTAFFSLLFLLNLPEEITTRIIKKHYSICDMGCALGEGTKILYDHFRVCDVKGLDFSPVAIQKAKETYQGLDFFVDDLTNLQIDCFDVAFSSNVLEHFQNPEQVLSQIMKKSKELVMIMVPYEEENLCRDHVVRFDKDSFPDEKEGFHKVFSKVIDCMPLVYRRWHGCQLMVIYAKEPMKLSYELSQDYFVNELFRFQQIWKKEEMSRVSLEAKQQGVFDGTLVSVEKIEELQNQIMHMEQSALHLTKTIQAYEDSLSWKLTRPLRYLSKLVKGKCPPFGK